MNIKHTPTTEIQHTYEADLSVNEAAQMLLSAMVETRLDSKLNSHIQATTKQETDKRYISTNMPPSSNVALISPGSVSGDAFDQVEERESTLKRRRVDEASPIAPSTNTPMFLEKTYDMLEKCSVDIACWSPTEDSFIVKNAVEFAEHIIPTYFKHKNFSSFVRQLNFYGFRKVRVVDSEIMGGVDSKGWWEFRHEKFRRGRKDLLRDIKRRTLQSSGSNNTHSNDNGRRSIIDRSEIDELRAEVCALREQIQQLNKHMVGVMEFVLAGNDSNNRSVPFMYSGIPSVHYTGGQQTSYPSIIPPTHGVVMPGIKHEGSNMIPPHGFTLNPLQSIVGNGGSLVPVPGYLGIPPYTYVVPSNANTSSQDWDTIKNQTDGQQAQKDSFTSDKGVIEANSSGATHSNNTDESTTTGVIRTQLITPTTFHSPQMPSIPFLSESQCSNSSLKHNTVTQIGNDLVECIVTRIADLIRSSSLKEPHEESEVITSLVDTILNNIQDKLNDICESDNSKPSETTFMYRVEIINHVSKVLPRVISESVEKNTTNRSLLAQTVKTIQSSLETKMRQFMCNQNTTTH